MGAKTTCDTPHGLEVQRLLAPHQSKLRKQKEHTRLFVGGAIPPTTGEIEVSPDTFVR